MSRYVDPNMYNKVKAEERRMSKEFGFGTPVETVAVDKDYGFVPMSTSQSAKGGTANIKKTNELNIKRFGLEQ